MTDTVPNAQTRVKQERNKSRASAEFGWKWTDIPFRPDPVDGRLWDSYELQNPMLSPGDRLVLLRTRLMKIASAALMARSIGVNEVTYQHHENGTRDVSLKAATKYAQHFGVGVDLLLTGSGLLVEVHGAVIAGGAMVDRLATDIVLPKTVYFARPPTKNGNEERLRLGAYIVADDLSPAYRLGDIIHFDKTRSLTPREATGRECVVELADGGRRLLRVVHAAPEGLWTLTSYLPNVPDLANVQLRSIWRVRFVEREGWDLLTGTSNQ